MPRPKGSKNRRGAAFRPAKAPEARPAPQRPPQAAPGALAGPPAPRPPLLPVPAATGATAAAAAAILGTGPGPGALPPPQAPSGGAPTAPPSPSPPIPAVPLAPAEAAALSLKERSFLAGNAVTLLDSLLQSFDPAGKAAPGPPPSWGLSPEEKRTGQERIAEVLAEVGPGPVMDFMNKHGAKIMLALWAVGVAWPRVNLWLKARERQLGSGTPRDRAVSPTGAAEPAALVPPGPAGPSDVERRLAGG